jgi:glycosyltransferase involved in cell wall biosynthesis
MAVYNAAPYIKEAIDSILGQTYGNFEFIIVDDGSTDESKEIIKSYNDPRILLIEQENLGNAIARNRGINKSQSSLIAILDADDISEKSRLATQFDYMNKNPGTALIGSNALVIDMSGEYIFTSDVPVKWSEIKKGIPFFSIYHSSVTYRKELAVKAGLYDERISNLNAFEDQLLWNRIAEYGIIENLKEPLICYRIQPNAVTGKSSKEGILAQIIIPELVSGRYPEAEIASLQNVKKALRCNEKYFNYHSFIAKKYLFETGDRLNAIKHVISALRYNPFGLKAIAYLILCFFPLSQLKRFKKRISQKGI